MKKTASITYYNSDTTDIIRLEAQAYGLQILDIESTGNPDEVLVTLKGEAENIEVFLEDAKEDNLRWCDSKSELPEDEYQFITQSELQKLGISYSPKFEPDEEDDEEAVA